MSKKEASFFLDKYLYHFFLISLVTLAAFLLFFFNLQRSGSAPTALAAQTFTTTVPASEDTYINSASPSANYGKAKTLKIDAKPATKSALLRFAVSNLPPDASISSVLLRLHVGTDTSKAGNSVWGVNGSWSQAATTWSNAPAIGNYIASLPAATLSNSSVDADITSVVTGNSTYDFYVTTNSSDSVTYSSIEAKDGYPPSLIITYASSPTPTPTIPPSNGDPIIVAAGDIACDPTSINFNGGSGNTVGCHEQATSDLILSINPVAVLTIGDTQYTDSTLTQFQASYDPTWGRFKSITSPVVGNHEYRTASASGYFDYFNGVGNFTGPAGDRDKGYYSYDIGTWHLIALNSNCTQVPGGCDVGSPQEQWLRSDLAAHPNTCTLAYWHHPRFSSGPYNTNLTVQALLQALYDNNADLLLTGHSHNYERFAPQDPNGNLDNARGIREFVAGMGGKEHQNFNTVLANSEVRNSDTFGVLKLTLHPGSYDWQFMPDSSGTFTDSGTTSCH